MGYSTQVDAADATDAADAATLPALVASINPNKTVPNALYRKVPTERLSEPCLIPPVIGMSGSARQTKRMVGAVAIVLLIIFTALAFLGTVSFIEWLIGDLVVALVANLIFRRLGKT